MRNAERRMQNAKYLPYPKSQMQNAELQNAEPVRRNTEHMRSCALDKTGVLLTRIHM